MSGRSDVTTMASRNLNCLPRSTRSCQSLAVASRPTWVFLGGWGFCSLGRALLLADLNASADGVCYCLQDLVMAPTIMAISKAFEQKLRICSNYPLFWQSWQAGESTRPQVNRLAGLGRMSYTDWTKNLKWYDSNYQSSAQVIVWPAVCSHVVQAPCLDMPTSLLKWASSTLALTSCWISFCFSFPLAFM